VASTDETFSPCSSLYHTSHTYVLVSPPLFVGLFEKYFENTTPSCSLKLCDSCDVCNLLGLLICRSVYLWSNVWWPCTEASWSGLTEEEECGHHPLRDGKTIGGRGRLTDQLMNIMQNYFGLALRNNLSSVEEMQRAVLAILYHRASSDKNPMHQYLLNLQTDITIGWLSSHQSKTNEWPVETNKAGQTCVAASELRHFVKNGLLA